MFLECCCLHARVELRFGIGDPFPWYYIGLQPKGDYPNTESNLTVLSGIGGPHHLLSLAPPNSTLLQACPWGVQPE